MRHARAEDLARLEGLLVRLRALSGLVEKSPGTFYRKGKAFLHFHEHDGELFADIRDTDDWQRLPVTKMVEQTALEKRARKACV